MDENSYYYQAKKTAGLVIKKQKAYGDSFSKSVKVIELLYPDGIKVEQYRDFLTVIRVIDKLFRIATKKDAFGENPWQDVNGYSLLELVKSAGLQEADEEFKDCKQKLNNEQKFCEDCFYEEKDIFESPCNNCDNYDKFTAKYLDIPEKSK